MGREKLAKEMDITQIVKRLRKARRTQALMLKYTDEHRQLIKNSQLKVLKFNVHREVNVRVDGASSDEEDGATQVHELFAKDMFSARRKGGPLSTAGSASGRSSIGSFNRKRLS